MHPGKRVSLLSTMHFGGNIDPDTGEKRQPEIITCNNSKDAVDEVVEIVEKYSVSRKCPRWPRRISFILLILPISILM
jgi:hypothetical protein